MSDELKAAIKFDDVMKKKFIMIENEKVEILNIGSAMYQSYIVWLEEMGGEHYCQEVAFDLPENLPYEQIKHWNCQHEKMQIPFIWSKGKIKLKIWSDTDNRKIYGKKLNENCKNTGQGLVEVVLDKETIINRLTKMKEKEPLLWTHLMNGDEPNGLQAEGIGQFIAMGEWVYL